MNRISEVFPDTVNRCVYGILTRMLQKKCKKNFSDGDDWECFYKLWHLVVNASTEENPIVHGMIFLQNMVQIILLLLTLKHVDTMEGKIFVLSGCQASSFWQEKYFKV